MNKPEKTKPRQRLEQRETDILDAATNLFASDGFHGTSTRKIASAAGVSEGTVFHYFSTKNELLLAILDKFYLELTQSAREIIEDVMETHERLHRLAINHVEALLDNNALMIRLLQVYLSVDLNYYTDYRKTYIHELNYQYTRAFDAVINEGITRGSLDPSLNLSAIRDLFFGGLENGMRTRLARQDGKDIAGYVGQIIDPLWRSMQIEPAQNPVAGSKEQARLERVCVRLEALADKLQ
jgi:TetR/AcrR family transcriptional regulator, fatty acid metabolism regulator protein